MKKGVVTEERGLLMLIGIIILALVMILLIAIHYKFTADNNFEGQGDASSGAGGGSFAVGGLLLPLAHRKKGSSATNILLVVLGILITIYPMGSF
jgi:hypothetical protein